MDRLEDLMVGLTVDRLEGLMEDQMAVPWEDLMVGLTEDQMVGLMEGLTEGLMAAR